MIYLATGKTYQTQSARDAYRIKSGKAFVFLVPEKEGVYQRPLNLMKAEAGVTIPGLKYTDENYVTWRLQFEATEDCELQEIEGGATKPLKQKFIGRASIPSSGETDFVRILIDHYVSKIMIKEDLFIYKSVQARNNDRQKALETIRGAAEGSSAGAAPEDRPQHRPAGKARPADWFRSCRGTILIMDQKTKIFTLLMTVAAAAAGVLMMAAAGRLFSDPWSTAAGFCLLLAGFLAFRSLAKGRILAEADRIAGQMQQRQFDEVFCRGRMIGRSRERRGHAISLLYDFERTENQILDQYEAVSGIVLAAVFWVYLLIQDPVAAAVIGILAAAGSGLLCSLKLSLRTIRMDAGQIRNDAEKDLGQFLANIVKVRLSGATDSVIRQYYSRIAAEKRMEQTAWRKEMSGQNLLRCMAGVAVFASAFAVGSIKGWDTEQIPVVITAGLLICLEGMHGALRLSRSCSDPFDWEDHGPDRSRADTEAAVLQREGEDDETSRRQAGPLILNHGSFAYDGRTVLEEVSCTVSEGEFLGIAGASGCGKSTLAQILSALMLPDEGTLYFEGTAITGDNPERIRSHSGIVLQDDQLLNGSIRENILAGRPEAGYSSILRAAELALLTDDVAQMPMEFETLISERAETVSAGQKQKILLARALISEPRIVFLDEAESELDKKTQDMLFENLRAHVPMGVIVSHHYRTLSKCDKIIMLDEGRIVEEGTPDELISNKGKFYQLMRQQVVTDRDMPGIGS